MSASAKHPILVIGAGIAGVTATLEAAEAGREVILVESEPSIGGRVVRNYHYFPKLCPPTCGMEINIQRIERNPRIRVLTQTRITKATYVNQNWQVVLTRAPQHVNEHCTACGECEKVCTAKVPDPVNLGLNKVPAIRLYHKDAWPKRYILNKKACSKSDLKAIVEACKYDAIDLDAKQTEETLEIGAVILATGWKPYPMEKLTNLGGGQIADVISNVKLERMAIKSGPTKGRILRPSNGQPPKKVAFVQCAGSRDVNHLPYCSGVCCLASLKQAIYVREQIPESEVTIFYIDRRTPGRNEDMLLTVTGMEGVKLIKGKVGGIEEQNGRMELKVEDVEDNKLMNVEADLVVLATGMIPNLAHEQSPFKITKDPDGFGLDDPKKKIFVAGVTRRPEDVAASVRDATGAAAKACVALGVMEGGL